MELHSVHKTFQPSHLGEQKHEMLSLNRRLETYLNRVKLLEEENALLAQEIQAVRQSSHGAVTRRKGLEEELRRTRLEVDAAWRDRVHTELEIGKLTEEFQNLDLQIQKEAQAHARARAMLEQSRKELEEEQRAQIWLREKVNQLENEMKHLIQTHHEEVAHLETAITHQRVTVPPALAHRANHTPNVLQLGQEYTQMASRARQEVSEAYEGQLARLEESFDQTSGSLAKLKQEKSEAQLRIRALQKEIASAQDVRLHLEKTAAQQRDQHSQEIQQLQEHMEGLEVEKEEVGQQIDHILHENRQLMQMKMSLSLEVQTYRALLDSESFRGDKSVLHQPRKVSIKDAMFFPRVVKKSYQTQLSAGRKITSLSPVCGPRGTGPVVTTAKTDCTRKPVTSSETAGVTESTKYEASYPEILQDGAVENVRRQEVHEKVAHAEPLSPPIDDKVLVLATSAGNEFKENGNSVDSEEVPVVESCVSSQVESGLSSELPISDEYCHLLTTSNLTPCLVRMTEMSCGFSDEPHSDVGCEGPDEKEHTQQLHATIDATEMKERTCMEEEQVQEEMSDSETEAVLEPTFESRTCSPTSECESEESAFNQFTDFSRGENIPNVGVVEPTQEISSSVVETSQTNVEDKLYPDGEEMDTWDCVIEKKADLKTDDETTNEEAKRQHAEPEEDISAREPGHEKTEIRQHFATDIQDNNVVSSVMDTHIYDDVQHAALDQEHVLLSDKDDDEEDSQNVSMSWRMEVEGDSYAQDNTLADTRPLIRYKSDETDANTQASHMDESESSDGEQEKKIGEVGTWSEGKSKKFGTMEDLCEEAEGEALDEEYDMGYTHTEDRNVERRLTTDEYVRLEADTEEPEEAIKNVYEGQLSEETEEFIEAKVPTNIDYDEQLEIDRLVEQELENLSTESYSAHFAQQLDCESQEMLSLQGNSVERMTDQEEAGKTEAVSSCADPADSVTQELTSTVTTVDEPNEKLHFSDSSVVIPHAESLADDETQHVEQEVIDAPRDEHNVSMVTHADETEDGVNDFISRPSMEEINTAEDPNSALEENLQDVIELTSSVTTVDEPNENLYFSDSSVVIPQAESLADDETQHVEQEVVDAPRDEHNLSMEKCADETEDGINEFISRPSMEEINNGEDPNSALQENLQDVHEPLKVKEVLPLDVSKDSQERLAEDVAEPAEWEVLEDPSEDSKATEETDKCDNVPESAESHHHDDKGSDEALTVHKDELLESSPDSVPAENSIFVVEDSTELMNKRGTDNDLHDVFSSGMKNDFWVSSVGTSATYQQDDACNETDEQTNQSLGFGDNLVWGNLENQNVVNGNSRVDTESTKALAAEEEQGQRHSEVKKVLSRNVEGEMVHSEESEIEGESWSSGEEQL
ncbi:nestin [Channa argus]|uniref:nestin n=1 Tax=Channa argus TaxID=215402 RepID=UPI002947AC2F|nr:hypothetical protein Q8A73_007470 [Channa argus]